MYKLSVAVPTSEMPNREFFFRRLLESLWNQSFQDFEIVVSDNSDDDVIETICEWYKTGINYIKNPRKGMAQNTNCAIENSKGELIKILYMDDFMAHDDALKNIVRHFKTGEWLATSCTHVQGLDDLRKNTHVVEWTNEIHKGVNTIGSPSVITIRNEGHLLFDENMTWLLDCDLYKRYYDIYGPPILLNDINVCIGLHDSQTTNLLPAEIKMWEQKYITEKYGNKQ